MTVDEAAEHISRAISAGRPANGYLVVGGVRGNGAELCNRVLSFLFGDGDLRSHPDIHRLAPEKKSRIISVESMRDNLIAPMEVTAYEGSWKAGVVFDVDRLGDAGANAFLKLLEEPPPQTIFMLLTEHPEQLLPTIVSRCQRIDLPDVRGRVLPEPERGEVISILASDGLKSVSSRAAAAGRLLAVLEKLKERARRLVDAEVGEDGDVGKESYEALVASRYREFRMDFELTVMDWFRDIMALCAVPPSHSSDVGGGVPLVNESRRSVLESRAARVSRAAAFRNVMAVEEFSVSLERRNMQELPVLSFLMDRLAIGTEDA